VDYLVSKPEVDKNKLASVGQSGGGQMALLITAVDERIKVCAASHPGGSMEGTYLLGQRVANREILSLIPPRPLRITVGDESG
jgi:dienelactone hydrolase